MTRQETNTSTQFDVIDGGLGDDCSRAPQFVIDPPQLSPSELAAEMAELFALALVRNLPLAHLDDPHRAIWLDNRTRISLHDILFELRSLPFYDANFTTRYDQTDAASYSRAGQSEADHRRLLRLNGDGQLTLRTLFQAGVVQPGRSLATSAFFDSDHAVQEPAPGGALPQAEAPMSAWLHWIAADSGAGLRLPGARSATPSPETPADLAAYVANVNPARALHSAALAALARGAAFDPGLCAEGAPVWGGPQLLALMAEAGRSATSSALLRHARADRLSRPAVFAARLSVYLARDGEEASEEDALLAQTAEELKSAAPNLLDWMTKAQTARGRNMGGAPALFLPICEPEDGPLHPGDSAAHVIVAGALATLVKAVFDTSQPAHLQMVGASGPGLALAQEADRLAANLAMGRAVGGCYFPAENQLDLRLGQALALELLRQKMEQANRSLSLDLVDFDGRALRLRASPRSFGRGHAELLIGGAPAAWPRGGLRRDAHLTAVV
ncbi:MAG: bromoperoxidase [Paracoccaceae bacterium]|nr:bromoperoxidase [Paracoccaceae bacterium]